MRRAMMVLVICALALAGCGGSSGDTTVPEPPKSAAYEKSGNAQVDAIVAAWQAQVPTVLTQYAVKQETIEQKTYQSTATLQEVADFYAQQITSANGWVEVRQMPGLQDGVFLKAYDNGNLSLVVGAFDMSQLGGQGLVIYTAKGSK